MILDRDSTPPGWRLSTFGREMLVRGGLVDPRDPVWSGTVLIAPNHIESGTGRVLARETAAEQGADSGKYVVRAGDLIYSKIRPSLNKVAVATEDCLCSADMYPVVPAKEADVRFCQYYMLADPFLTYAALAADRVKMPKVNREELSGAPWLVPALAEQRRIADYLDRETATIDALIAKQVELMNRLRERRQAVIDRAFVSTSEIVILRRHLVLNDSGAWGEDPTGVDDVAVLRSTEQTVDGYWAISDPALRTLSQTERQNTRLREGDLIVTKTSGSFKHVGKTTLVDNEVAEGGYGFGNFMQMLRLKSTMIPKFLWWFMRTDQARSWINLVATTSTGLMNLNGSTLGRMEVPLPSLVEQREIADHLDRETATIDALIAKAERFIELAQERRAALITAAVTGQIEIPTED